MPAELQILPQKFGHEDRVEVKNIGLHRAVRITYQVVANDRQDARGDISALPETLEAGDSCTVFLGAFTDSPSVGVLTIEWESLAGTKGKTSGVLRFPK